MFISSLIGPAIGGLLGSGGSSQTQSTQNTIDPRMSEYVYGANGILPNAASWYGQNKSGMNSQMQTGMNNQWNQLGASGAGYNQMQNLGLSLMGGGVAGNPFTNGAMASGGQMPQPQPYQPMGMQTGAQPGAQSGGQSPFQMPNVPAYTPPPAAAQPGRTTTPEQDFAQMLQERQIG